MAVKIGSPYKWVKGDNVGNEEVVSDITKEFVIFKSNRRCSVDVFSEFLIPKNSAVDNIQRSSNRRYAASVTGVQFQQEDDGVITDAHGQLVHIPALDNTIEHNDVTSNPEFRQHIEHVEVAKKVKEIVNPITTLINQATKEECVLSLDYTVKLPKKSLYSLLKESFENADIDNEILEVILTEISIDDMKKYFKENIKERIKLHYKSK